VQQQTRPCNQQHARTRAQGGVPGQPGQPGAGPTYYSPVYGEQGAAAGAAYQPAGGQPMYGQNGGQPGNGYAPGPAQPDPAKPYASGV
jgi:hypothetical protein